MVSADLGKSSYGAVNLTAALSHYSQLLTITHQAQGFIARPSVIQPLNPDTSLKSNSDQNAYFSFYFFPHQFKDIWIS